jgi:predicted dehydrogenase
MKSVSKKIRYAVIGQGFFSQVAILPAFRNARANSELVALVSDDPVKLKKLGAMYHAKKLCSYDQYDELLKSGEIDAVYIALPNDMHGDYAIRAARAGIHVLCEKPMEVTSLRAIEMMDVAEECDVRLMIAYRLHFEKANLTCVDLVKRGKLGMAKYFSAQFSHPVKKDNIRSRVRAQGGGPLYDIGIYCINAARSVFQSEPIEVLAMETRSPELRDVEESMAVTLRFPGERLASFVCSNNADDQNHFEVAGTKGSLRLDNAFEFAGDKVLHLKIKGKSSKPQKFKPSDQVAPELLYFSDCILGGKEIEPSALEGLADLRGIEAVFESARTGSAVQLSPVAPKPRPGLRQEMTKSSAASSPKLINAESPAKTG